MVRSATRPHAWLRLFCIPHAGGGAAAFASWPARLPDWIELCALELPGRGARRSEAPFRRLEPLVSATADAIRPLLDKPFALLGCSLGALHAYELALSLAAEGSPPSHVFTVSASAPNRPFARIAEIHALDDRSFLEAIAHTFGGMEPAVLANPALAREITPTLRADFELMTAYRLREAAPLPCPLGSFGADQDRACPVSDVEAWRGFSADAFFARILHGSHLFFLEDHEALLREIVVALECRRERANLAALRPDSQGA